MSGIVLLIAATAPLACAEDAFDLVLLSYENKKQAIKAVHDISGITLKDSATLIETLPKAILAGVSRDQALKGQKHAEAMTCKTEVRAADPKLAGAPQWKFDMVLKKVDPKTKDSVVAALNNVLPKEQQSPDNARKLVDSAPVTVMVGLSGAALDEKSHALTAAGGAVELVSTGGVETGGFNVVLTKLDVPNKPRAIATIREHTGLGVAAAKARTENLPALVKVKVSKEEAEKIKAALEGSKATVEVKESGK
jgi:large subunit ribosomal protein L7/L12